MTVTIDEAKCCPRCSQAGEQTAVSSGPRGSRIYNFACRNPICRWYNTGWIVQVKADGTIPIREPGEKEFGPMPNFDSNKERVEEMIQRQVEEETKGQ